MLFFLVLFFREVVRKLLVGVLFFRRGGPKVSCRCSFMLGSGRSVGVAFCVVSRRVWGHGAVPCASGGGRRISCTMVHRACAVQYADTVQVVIATDARWTHVSPRSYLGGA